jgi:hypothetical protein
MLFALIQLILIAIRLDCVVDWPWLLILSPTIIVLAGFLLFGPPVSMEFYKVDHEEESEE